MFFRQGETCTTEEKKKRNTLDLRAKVNVLFLKQFDQT